MLVYLDTAQFAWLERADADDQAGFVEAWRGHGCELAISIQLLQEVVKRGSPEDIERRLGTIARLEPLRGLPPSAAGLIVREATAQMAALLGQRVGDIRAYGRATLFPALDSQLPRQIVEAHEAQLTGFNETGRMQAILQTDARSLPKVKPGVRIDPADMAAHVDRMNNRYSSSFPPETAAMFRAIGDAVVQDVANEGGDTWAARIKRWGLEGMESLAELKHEDYSKAAAFLEMARDAAEDIAADLGINQADVLKLVDKLRPYDAPGFSLEMAVARARGMHATKVTAADQVDEEHVCFAPYVDLLFVDRRTRDYVQREVRRKDGRVVAGADRSIVGASKLADVLEQVVSSAAERA